MVSFFYNFNRCFFVESERNSDIGVQYVFEMGNEVDLSKIKTMFKLGSMNMALDLVKIKDKIVKISSKYSGCIMDEAVKIDSNRVPDDVSAELIKFQNILGDIDNSFYIGFKESALRKFQGKKSVSEKFQGTSTTSIELKGENIDHVSFGSKTFEYLTALQKVFDESVRKYPKNKDIREVSKKLKKYCEELKDMISKVDKIKQRKLREIGINIFGRSSTGENSSSATTSTSSYTSLITSSENSRSNLPSTSSVSTTGSDNVFFESQVSKTSSVAKESIKEESETKFPYRIEWRSKEDIEKSNALKKEIEKKMEELYNPSFKHLRSDIMTFLNREFEPKELAKEIRRRFENPKGPKGEPRPRKINEINLDYLDEYFAKSGKRELD